MEHVVTDLGELAMGERLSAEDFELSFPPGTVVRERHTGSNKKGSTNQIKDKPEITQSLVLEGGGRREIRPSYRLVAFIAMGVLLIGVGVFFWKKKKGEIT
jgi:hypothetical protein